MDGEKHSRLIAGGRAFYWTERLWRLSAALPIARVPITDIAEFDQDCWFHGATVTCRMVADHARRIEAADVRFPVILSADGGLMDGGHRIARAWIHGELAVAAVQFEVDPEPDWVVAS